MAKTILVVLVKKRAASAVKVQQVLTDYGCIIKTRVGIHDGVADRCADEGLILLELLGPAKDVAGLDRGLRKIAGVKTKLVKMSL